MDTTGRRFDPTKYLRAIKTRSGKQEMYLPVPARLLWLRADHPNASVLTEALKLDDRNAIFKATITLPGGAVAVGHGSEAAGDFGDFIEKAESKAIGRALAALGYGIEFAEMQEDSTLASATDVAPALIPPASAPAVPPPVAPVAAAPPTPATPVVAPAPTPAPVQPPQPVQPPPPASAPLIEAVAPRPERNDRNDRNDRYDARPERTDRADRSDRPDMRTDRNDRNDRTDRPEPRADRTEQRIERPERSDRPDMRNDRADRYAPPPPRSLIDRVPRPERSERMEPADELPLGRPLSTPTPIERPARPERISRSREILPAMGGNSAPDFPPMEEETPPAPTPIRRTGRTLIGRPAGTLPPLPGLPAPDASPPLAALPQPPRALEPDAANETGGAGEAGEAGESDDELEPATISTTSFWRWAKSKGYPDRRAVEAATGRSMDTMTPREAYFRLREVIARGTAQ